MPGVRACGEFVSSRSFPGASAAPQGPHPLQPKKAGFPVRLGTCIGPAKRPTRWGVAALRNDRPRMLLRRAEAQAWRADGFAAMN